MWIDQLTELLRTKDLVCTIPSRQAPPSFSLSLCAGDDAAQLYRAAEVLLDHSLELLPDEAGDVPTGCAFCRRLPDGQLLVVGATLAPPAGAGVSRAEHKARYLHACSAACS